MENMNIKENKDGIIIKAFFKGEEIDFATKGAAAMDLKARLSDCNPNFFHNVVMLDKTNMRAITCKEEDGEFYWKGSNLSVEIGPGGRLLVPTGLHIQLPKGLKANVRPRSGLALKHGITVLNSPGLIDEDYRGDIGVILINHSDEYYMVNDGDRIAQLEVELAHKFSFKRVPLVEDLSKTDRGEGGFGHTGK